MELIKDEQPISMVVEDEYSYEEYSDEEEYSDDDDMDASDYYDKEESSESEEDIISDRVEVDRGIKYVVKDGPTITRPKVATKTYFRRHRCYPFRRELYRYEFPLSTFAKFALDRYNHIERTEYKYVGLVKAYSRAIAGFCFEIRFKACLPDQDHGIYFQASIFQGIRNKITGVAYVAVESVYPLPAPVMPVKELAEQVSAAAVLS